MGDIEKREKYDRILFGDASRGDFSNQEAYDYWKDKKAPVADKKYKSPEEQRQDRINEKLRNAQDYSDFTSRFEHHREKSAAREHLMRGEGFKDLNDKYGHDYDYYSNAGQEHSDKYI